jgi:hypothetical protein
VRLFCILLGAVLSSFAFARMARHGSGLVSNSLLAAAAASVLTGMFAPVHLARRFLVLGLVSAMTLLMAEVVLRTAFTAEYAYVYEADARLIFRLIPGTSKVFRRSPQDGGQAVTMQINSRGYRGEELRVPGEARRVVVYGDSNILAEFSERQDTFVERLRAGISATLGTPIETINAGTPAYGPDQVLLRMEEELPGLQADLVVVAVFADNDFGDLLRNRIFSLDEAGALRTNDYVLSDSLRRRFDLGSEMSYVVRALRRIREQLARVDQEAWDERAEQRVEGWLAASLTEHQRAVLERSASVENAFDDHYDADMSLLPHGESARDKRALMEAVLTRIKATAAQASVPMVLLVIPSVLDVCDQHTLGSINTDLYPDYDRRAMTRALADIAERLDIPVLDLYEPYRERGANSLYFRSADNHWNDAGQSLAAELMTALIVERGLL